MLTATNLSVRFSGRLVLDSFSLELAQGEQCALTGRSGSGKTTLLLVLARLLSPTSGTVVLGCAPEQVVYVPQAPSLVPELTAVQNASLGLRVRGVVPSHAEDLAREQLRALGLDDADDALPSDLSGGMQQRVALARALAVRPALLLVDEPTGSLDHATGLRVIARLLEHARSTDASLVVATHDPEVGGAFNRQVALAAIAEEELAR